MIIFRPQRGGLLESMAESQEFETILDMKNFLVSDSCRIFGKPLFSIDDIVISGDKKHDDHRIGWKDVESVCVKRYGNEDYIEKYGCPQCIGMCSENYKGSLFVQKL